MNDDHLDDLLAAYVTAEPGADLRGRIIAGAPRQRTLGRAWRWLAGAALGVGLAGSCAAGVAAGFTLAPAGVTHLIGAPAGGTDAEATSSLADPAGDAADG
jgi:hypothetical protein